MEADSPKEPRQSEQDYRHIAEQIFFHVLLHGGEGNPFRQIANKWFIDLAAPKLRELLGAPKEPRQSEQDNRPFDKLPDAHVTYVENWLTANHKSAFEVRWSLYPIGMVQRWIERAEQAEAPKEPTAPTEEKNGNN